jgi:hypothetical protein
VQAKIQADISSVGWSWIAVFDPENEHPPFAYSIGFGASFGKPEVVVVGMPQGPAVGVLETVYEVLQQGRTFSDGDTSDEILEDGLLVRFRALSEQESAEALVQAATFSGVDQVPALQLIWPNREGKFPGDPDAPPGLEARQTLVP